MPAPKPLTDTLIERIADAVRRGCSLQEAAEAASVGETTLHGWLAKGRADLEAEAESREGILAGLVEDARAEWRMGLLDRIARSKDWKALAWTLEREQKVVLGAAKVSNIRARTKYLKARIAAEQSLEERLRTATDEELREALLKLREARANEPAVPDE